MPSSDTTCFILHNNMEQLSDTPRDEPPMLAIADRSTFLWNTQTSEEMDGGVSVYHICELIII